MKRKIYEQLLKWKKEDAHRTALLIDGARRVGKSYIAEEFAKCEYDSYILIDFNKAEKKIKELFENQLNDLDTLFAYLSAYFNVQLVPGKSLIVFDEVQLCPRARAAIKYLVADGRYHFLETGSLMTIKANVSDIVIPSEERHLKMYPLDFEEFLWGVGNETLMPFIADCMHGLKPLGEAMHRKTMDYFRQYLLVGGMPQVVREYVDSRDFIKVDAVKRDILTLYRADIIKHAKGYERKVEAIFDDIPSQLQRHEKSFRLSSLEKKARFREYEDALFWLDDAMIINNCYQSTEPSIGLRMNRERTNLKCYMGDTGLLISHAFDEKDMVSEEIYKRLLFGALEFNEGMIMENIVAQMLTAAGHRLYFYSNASRENADERMKIDFLIEKSKITSRHNISPIEVKSGKNYTFSSLRKFCRKFAQQLDRPLLLHNGDVTEKDGFQCLPLYMTPLL
ncbi:MAG: ATP-binding protein [Victivallales bacterium]|nr:ATP-binding protein [Victivallales bacterium]